MNSVTPAGAGEGRAPATQGLVAVIAATCLWATLGVAGKALYAKGALPFAVIGWRAVIAATVLFAILAVRAPRLLRVPAHEIPFFALLGLVVAGNYACYFVALRRVPVAVAIILLYTYPAFTTLAARLWFNEALTPQKLLAVALTFVGVTLIAAGGSGPAFGSDGGGLLLGLGSGLTMTAYGLLGKRATRHLSPWTTAACSFVFAAAWFAMVRGHDMATTAGYTAAMWAGLAYIGVGPTLAAYGLFLWAVQRIEVSRVSVWTTLEPAISALLAYLILGEALQPLQGIGGALVALGVAMLQGRSAERSA